MTEPSSTHTLRDAPYLAWIGVLLALPLVAFNLGFLHLWIGAPASALLGLGLVLLIRREGAGRWDLRLMMLCTGIGLALVVLGGEGHLVLPTPDWWIRDAVFSDLISSPWPVTYLWHGEVAQLRAPLGLYLAPAVVGKLLGDVAGYAALVLQNGFLLALCLYAFACRIEPRQRFMMLGAFVAFSGLDVIAWVVSLLAGHNLGFFMDGWSVNIAYLSHVTQIFWAPHHTIAAWSFVAGYLAWRDAPARAPWLPALLALGVFWSPLAVMGALPFAGYAGLRTLVARRPLAAVVPAAFCLAGALPAVLHMMMDSSSVERGWLIGQSGFWRDYAALEGIEILPFVAYLTLRARAQAPIHRLELACVSGLLLLFPLYKIHFTNDFTMRACIPALTLLALMFSRELARHLQSGALQTRWIIFVVMLMVVTPAVEIVRALRGPNYPLPSCNLLTAWQTGPWKAFPLSAYVARQTSLGTFGELMAEGSAPMGPSAEGCAPRGTRLMW